MLPPPASPGGLSADQQPMGNTTNGINAGRKTGTQAGNQPGGHQPTEATTAAGTHTRGTGVPTRSPPRAARSQVSPHPRHVAAGFSVHPDNRAGGPTISSSNWEESQHQVMDSSELETLLETSPMAGKTVQTREASGAAPPTHRQTSRETCFQALGSERREDSSERNLSQPRLSGWSGGPSQGEEREVLV